MVIDWYNIWANAIWIMGLAILLATVSGGRWLAQRQDCYLKQILKRPNFQVAIWTGFLLISLALLLLADIWWERLIWSVYCLIFLKNCWSHVK